MGNPKLYFGIFSTIKLRWIIGRLLKNNVNDVDVAMRTQNTSQKWLTSLCKRVHLDPDEQQWNNPQRKQQLSVEHCVKIIMRVLCLPPLACPYANRNNFICLCVCEFEAPLLDLWRGCLLLYCKTHNFEVLPCLFVRKLFCIWLCVWWPSYLLWQRNGETIILSHNGH